jgi:squalene synthase HpnC
MNGAFAADLAAFGPEGDYAPLTPEQARGYCARFTRRNYENFTVASVLLPRKLLPHFQAVYAYCRWADDLADETGGGPRALDLLAWWRRELLACYDGASRHPVMVALRRTIEQFRIPPGPFLDLLLAFEQDQRVQRYTTFDELLGYCRNSANPVGRLVLYLGEAFNDESAALSDDICTALQLTNFWQDVRRDLDIGRVYLPEEDRLHFAYSDADLEARRYTPAFVSLMAFEVKRTRALFARGSPLIDRVPPNLRTEIELFVAGGLGILGKIEKQSYDVWSCRPVLSKWEKAVLLMRALGHRWWNRARAKGGR